MNAKIKNILSDSISVPARFAVWSAGLIPTAVTCRQSSAMAQAPNQGMRRGAVVHVDEVADAIVQAVTEAERISGMSIKHATVNVNGSHVSGINSEGVIAISAANREITPEDRLRVEEAATIV